VVRPPSLFSPRPRAPAAGAPPPRRGGPPGLPELSAGPTPRRSLPSDRRRACGPFFFAGRRGGGRSRDP
ncbi:hypothetical protein, partial [Actinomadura sp. NPDC000929]|uniref:hypothetical protein n=1 Tax=Actinomadura sp. NPDC000929 TaxID=3154517 RepID=UPI00339790BA